MFTHHWFSLYTTWKLIIIKTMMRGINVRFRRHASTQWEKYEKSSQYLRKKSMRCDGDDEKKKCSFENCSILTQYSVQKHLIYSGNIASLWFCSSTTERIFIKFSANFTCVSISHSAASTTSLTFTQPAASEWLLTRSWSFLVKFIAFILAICQ